MAAVRSGGRPLYDTCLDEFERGMPAERISEIFDQVKPELQLLIQRVLQSEHKPDEAALGMPEGLASLETSKQEALSREVVGSMGFDLSQGRVDVSVHPFTTSFSPADVRITSRFNDKARARVPPFSSLFSSLWIVSTRSCFAAGGVWQEWYQGLAGSMHECGHALYESQLRNSNLPVDTALSMGVHESQSLFWERHIGPSSSLVSAPGDLAGPSQGAWGSNAQNRACRPFPPVLALVRPAGARNAWRHCRRRDAVSCRQQRQAGIHQGGSG